MGDSHGGQASLNLDDNARHGRPVKHDNKLRLGCTTSCRCHKPPPMRLNDPPPDSGLAQAGTIGRPSAHSMVAHTGHHLMALTR